MNANLKCILCVEDEPEMIDLIRLILGRRGFEVKGAAGGIEGLKMIRDDPPDLVLLDLMMPDMDGWEVYQQMKADEKTKNIPVIVVTAKAQSIDRVLGLHIAKVDDYITKPFSVRELLARVRAVLRRLDESTAKTYEDDHLMIDFSDIRVLCNGRRIKLTNKEFTLLSVLAKSPDRVVTRQQLLDSVWGYSYYGDARTLDVHIRRLRQKLMDCGDCIETVVGVGYRFTGCPEKHEISG